MTIAEDLGLSLEMARAASDVALSLWRGEFSRSTKPDGSLVTQADLAVEKRLLEMLGSSRPDDAILSEECGALGSGRRRWILDPIDGTYWFASGEHSWGTHVALEQDGEILIGVISRPAYGEFYWAARGLGAHRGALESVSSLERLRVSRVTGISDSRIMVWAPPEDPRHDVLRAHARHVEPSIDGVLAVATGRLEAIVDAQGAIWDLAPAVAIVEEAGGRFSDASGGRALDRPGSWFTNGSVDEALRTLLA